MKPRAIVGVGASAGGLEAFTELLRHLPGDTGLGVVLVQHLDPQHPSILAKLLDKVAAVPVREAADGVAVEADHVYVIPANADMVIAGGLLRLRRREAGHPARCVDRFLQSLASDSGGQPVGVILSGTGSDGTLGLEAVKAEGGITFAQDESAKYPGMPRSAAAAGCVDFTLPPKGIARELARIARHPGLGAVRAGTLARRPARAAGGEPPAAAAGSYGRVLALLRRHSGVDFSLYKPATLHRRINRRMILRKKRSLEAYLGDLRRDAAERGALYQDVLISVTGFFRNPETFDALRRTVYPRLFKDRKPADPVRVWVPGCSTGQEAYSLAMSLADFAGERSRVPVQIYATDLNEGLLEKARAGLYPKDFVQDVPAGLRERYFVEEEGGCRVVKSLRGLCVFARHNLLADAPFSRMDLVSCRNLMIYLDAPAQRAALNAFHYALSPKGFLVLGASETTASSPGLFAGLDKKHKVFMRPPGPVKPPFPRFPPPRGARGEAAPFPPRPPRELREADVSREADRVALGRYAPAGVLIGPDLQVLQFRGTTSPYLEPPRGNATFELLKMAREGLLLPLREAIGKARAENRPVRRENIRFAAAPGRRGAVSIEVVPLKNLKEPRLLVFFEPAPPKSSARRPAGRRLSPARESREVSRLRQELANSRDYLQSLQEQFEAAHEELQASGEEAQSSNEELQSINEELETSKEELESTNEELTSVNDELGERNAELTRLGSDLANLLASVDMAILVLGRDLRIRRFTRPAEKLFNLLAGDVGRPLDAVKSRLELPDLAGLVREVVEARAVKGREVRDADGRWHALRALPYLDADGRVDGAVLTAVDVTELKRAQEQAELARGLAETIVDTVPPLLILDGGLRVKQANRSFFETFQVDRAGTEGRLVYELGNRQWDIPELRRLLAEALAQGRRVENFEVEHRFETIGTRVMSLTVRRLDAESAEGAAVVVSVVDITALKRAETALRTLNAELERTVERRTADLAASNLELETFSYSVAHDLRTPLRAIASFSAILMERHAAQIDADGLRHFGRIRAASERMALLIAALLDLARLSRAELRQGPVDLSEQARTLAAELKRGQPERDVAFAAAPGLTAWGDERLTRIALANLLENAWKFTGNMPGARVEFGALERGGERVYFVRDNGAGFDLAYSDKLFMVFQRLHAEREYPGLGIGLSIVQRIVQRHGGRIWAEGAVGSGAAFYFTLPPPPAAG